jgi:DNA (cytosine-5)-methyltransferase 1
MAKFKTDLFAPSCTILPWVTGHDIIDWSLPISSIFTRKKALVAKTIRRILLGLDRFGLRELTLGGSVLQGHSYLVHQMGQSVAQEVTAPISAITGGPKHYLTIPVLTKLDADTNLPPCLLSPDPMIRCIVEDVMDSIAPSNFQFHHEWHSSGRPIIVIEGVRYVLEILFRMLQVPELSAGQGFPRDYQFKGTQTEVIKQIGNAVPCNTARALVKAVLTQNSNVGLPSCDRRALNSGGEIQPH